ncbi:MAG: hypothetical protein DME24_15750 [Verrucomicrobia bacterium]|nr:MAG: hypothetical protein DME24_15750 [Verrucomicrobiota bacterium]
MASTQTDRIEVTAELAKELIPILEDKIAGFESHIVSLEDERDRLRRTLAELKAKLNGQAASVSANGSKKRLRKGEAVKIVHELLTSLPNNGGLSIKDIVSKTGVSYGSVFRTLHKDKKHRFKQDNGLWKVA